MIEQFVLKNLLPNVSPVIAIVLIIGFFVYKDVLIKKIDIVLEKDKKKVDMSIETEKSFTQVFLNEIPLFKDALRAIGDDLKKAIEKSSDTSEKTTERSITTTERSLERLHEIAICQADLAAKFEEQRKDQLLQNTGIKMIDQKLDMLYKQVKENDEILSEKIVKIENKISAVFPEKAELKVLPKKKKA